MPTIRQRKAIEALVENGGIVSQAMLTAGYTPTTAKTPQKLTESIGFQELCEEHGLTDTFLLKALVEDIKKKPQNRKAELELGFKVKQRLKEEEPGFGAKVLVINIASETGKRYGVQPGASTDSVRQTSV